MPRYSQANRLMSVTTPLGPDVLLLQRVTGAEAVSRLFRFELEMLAESTATVKFDSILGKSVTVSLVMPADDSKRYINGIVSRFSQGGRRPSAEGSATFTTIAPRWSPSSGRSPAITRAGSSSSIAVPDILKKVLTGLNVELSAPGRVQAARLLRPVPRDGLRLRQPADGGRGDLLLLHALPTAPTRWWSPTRSRASRTCRARRR